jgi:hypothetical protein
VLVCLVYNAISDLLTQAEQVACFRNPFMRETWHVTHGPSRSGDGSA